MTSYQYTGIMPEKSNLIPVNTAIGVLFVTAFETMFKEFSKTSLEIIKRI